MKYDIYYKLQIDSELTFPDEKHFTVGIFVYITKEEEIH